ncbi:MAG: bifunctional folylpolyglutamate synthase/dihydrofolate synthase [Chloroflexi bacterium]|nr:bifunctional folylpolyglutamate synthase/dihydrofolate synthase [Chloroflexota bacterium]
MNYAQALDRLLSLTDLERVSGHAPHVRRMDLGRIRLLLERLGDPHLSTPTVHITGTKGKGSTAALIASALAAGGYRPGLFTSPHLHTFRERIQYDGAPVSEAEFAALVEEVWPELEAVGREGGYGSVTTFELLTAMAFLHYHRKGAGFQVVEVGLGGRLDSTNVVRPQVCVFTSISLDHTAILGDTVEEIAGDKAGILKPGCVAVTSPQQPGVMAVLRDAAQSQGAPLIATAEECRCVLHSHDLDGQSFTLATRWGEYKLHIPLLGAYQLENAATALASLQALNDWGFTLSGVSIAQGFRDVRWPARLEVLSREPLVVADGAHNPYSAGKLREALHQYFGFRRLIYVIGLSADKNIPDIVKELAQGGPTVVVTRSRHPRAASPLSLAEEFARAGVQAVQVESVDAAAAHALALAGPRDMVVATGSLFVAAEARESYLHISPELYPSLDMHTSLLQRSV